MLNVGQRPVEKPEAFTERMILTYLLTIVDLRSPPFLPRPPYHPCWVQEGSPI